jgi:predicted O-methyltransferase YrrM
MAGGVLIEPIIEQMHSIEGWLDEQEARLLITGATRALSELPSGTVVEVGSYVGRSTSVLGSVVQAMRPTRRLYAIDPHEGVLTTSEGALLHVEPTWEAFRRTLVQARIEDVVEAIVARSYDVFWDRPIAFLFIDGMHDANSVREDFWHFQPWLVTGAYAAFHDYDGSASSVKAFVDELVESRRLTWIGRAGTLVLLRHEA